MTKHDRMMTALAEIKEFCKKQNDYIFGCGKKCPFLMGKEGDDFRDCEIMKYIRHGEPIDTPEEWGEQDNG